MLPTSSNPSNRGPKPPALAFISLAPSCDLFKASCATNQRHPEPASSSNYLSGNKRNSSLMNKQIRVPIVDDHTLFRESLGRLLEDDTECKIVAARARQWRLGCLSKEQPPCGVDSGHPSSHAGRDLDGPWPGEGADRRRTAKWWRNEPRLLERKRTKRPALRL